MASVKFCQNPNINFDDDELKKCQPHKGVIETDRPQKGVIETDRPGAFSRAIYELLDIFTMYPTLIIS